jgi:putative flavoprotein involved in K+ transport
MGIARTVHRWSIGSARLAAALVGRTPCVAAAVASGKPRVESILGSDPRQDLSGRKGDGAMLDAVVVGAGGAGLGVSHALAEAGLRHRVLERGRIGETWRTQRWDSFRMNLPNIQISMPGDDYDGPDPEGFMTGDDFVELLANYAECNRLPVQAHTPVTELSLREADSAYRLDTPRGALEARNVVIASGTLNCPIRPTAAAALPAHLSQVNSSDYRNPAALPPGAVLVVGSAQSGGQIAEDLALAGRTVYLATCRVGRIARRYRGKDIALWLAQSGLFDVPRKEFTEPSGHITARPLLGAVHTISLQSLSAQGVVLLGRFIGTEGGRLTFADDVEANLCYADESSVKTKRHIDDYIAAQGLDAPLPAEDPAETVAPCAPDPPIVSLDPTDHGISTVVWCTGFHGDFNWVRLPGVLDGQGQPVQDEGVAPLPGIFFAGLDFSSTRRSGTVLAIAEEARRIVDHIEARRGV